MMHASPPTFAGLSTILSLDPKDNFWKKRIERSANNFLVTEIGFDYTQDEVVIPTGLISWKE